MLIVFDDMIADMLINKKLNQIVTEFFIRGRKLNISSIFFHTILFRCSKKEFQQIAFNYSSDIDF